MGRKLKNWAIKIAIPFLEAPSLSSVMADVLILDLVQLPFDCKM